MIEDLREEAEALGISVDGRWGEAKLMSEIAKANGVEEVSTPQVERKYTVDVYLKDKDYPQAIKKMIVDMFRGTSRTMEAWAVAVESITTRRC